MTKLKPLKDSHLICCLKEQSFRRWYSRVHSTKLQTISWPTYQTKSSLFLLNPSSRCRILWCQLWSSVPETEWDYSSQDNRCSSRVSPNYV